jgi:hypothetical protein
VDIVGSYPPPKPDPRDLAGPYEVLTPGLAEARRGRAARPPRASRRDRGRRCTARSSPRAAPGRAVVVDDRSTIHNFHLASNDDPTVDFRTDLAFVGQKSFTVTFKNNNEYAYACEPHWQVMNGKFLVTDAPPPPPPPPPPPGVRTLKASVSAAGTVR